jgi:D-tyrosyl-tRNA(Tyr) deacylase
MIALIQRVAHARVEVGPRCTGAIDAGLLALIGIQPGDDAPQRKRMLALLLGYRIFEDDCGRMNRSLQDVQGGLLLVPQFTLAADTRSGLRPSFSSAASTRAGSGSVRAVADRGACRLSDRGQWRVWRAHAGFLAE